MYLGKMAWMVYLEGNILFYTQIPIQFCKSKKKWNDEMKNEM